MTQTRPTVRIGIVGAGMIGRSHAHAFRALPEFFYPLPATVELTAVADADAALAREAGERYGFGRVARSWEEVVSAPDVDAVCLALPNFQHREAAEAAFAAGKAVLCEKPLAVTPADAHAMLTAARRSGVVHAVGFNLRRAPAIATIARAATAGDFGEIRHFSGRYLTDYGVSPEVPFTWRYARDLAGGGALADIGSHVIDLARSLVGEMASVQGAVLATYVRQRPVPAGHVTGHSRGATTGELREVTNDDVATFTARFSNGAVGDFRFSRVATGYRNSPAFELIGSRGSVQFDMERAAEFGLFDGQPDDPMNGFRRVVIGPHHPYFGQVAAFPVTGVGYGYTETYVAQAFEFVRAVAAGDTSYAPSFEDGARVMAVCEAVQRSADEGRPVDVALP